jgi:hypothetical protein
MENPELLPQLPVNVTAVILGQKIVTEETLAAPTEIVPLTVTIRGRMIPTVEIIMALMETNTMTVVILW